MFTSKEIVQELIESTGDNRWFVNTKTIGTQVGHRHFPPLAVQRHVTESVKRLSAKQKKIAAMAGDKDKIDADDLAKLRSMKEDSEQVDEKFNYQAAYDSHMKKAETARATGKAHHKIIAANAETAARKIKSKAKQAGVAVKEEEMRPEIAQIIEDSTTKAWMNVHTKGSKEARDRLDKVHAKNPAYHAFKKSLEGHSSGPAEKPKAAEKPAAAHKDSGETPAQKLRRINSERQKAYYAKGGGRGVGSAGTASQRTPLEKKLGGHEAGEKKSVALGASPSERAGAKAEKKEKEKSQGGDRVTKKLTGRDLKEMILKRRG